MIKKLFTLIVLTIIFSISTGFAQMQESRLELDFGTSYKLQKYSQTLNPDADKNLEPVYGLNGNAAHENIKEYVKSFEKSVKEPVYTFTIGADGGK
ncbi:MAG TPA: hypothetical protein DDX85_06455 [Nitrospiraceae bacterium]|nr:hypothetical protein [Nitrospiraceae bacterium]